MWFILSLVAGLLFASSRLTARSVLTKDVHPLAFGSAHNLLAGLLLLPLGLYALSLPQSPIIWFSFALVLLSIFVCDLFAFLCLKYIEASLYQIIGQIRHVVVLFGAYFLFAEDLSVTKIVAIMLIILGVIVAMMGKAKIEINKGTVYAFISTVCIALAFLFIKMTSVDVAPAFSGSLALLVSGGLMYGMVIFKKEPVRHLITGQHRLALLGTGVMFALFELVLFTALALGDASKVTPVAQSSMIFTIIGGYIFLHERSHMKQKIVGSILIALGIILMYFI